MPASSEDRLFRRYRKTGDPQDLGRVFDLAAPRLLHTALHLTREPSQAEDLLQATFLTAIQKAESYDASRPLLPWLTGILTRHAAKARQLASRSPDPGRLRQGNGEDPVARAEGAELVYSAAVERQLQGEVGWDRIEVVFYPDQATYLDTLGGEAYAVAEAARAEVVTDSHVALAEPITPITPVSLS